MKLGVNIDHVATVRQARRGDGPDPVLAAQIAEKAGADSIVAHLREDRRHIQDADIFRLKKVLKKRFNLEMSIAPEIVRLALKVNPDQVTLVPERRQEITTEGGLDVIRHSKRLKKVCADFLSSKIVPSLFIAPDKNQILATRDIGVTMIEIHTGHYAHAKSPAQFQRELKKITAATDYALSLGMTVNAGHGLDYQNVKAIAKIRGMEELNIGHSIVSRSIIVGLEKAVREMKALI